MRKHRTPMCNCTSENLEIPGLVLTHHPGLTEAPIPSQKPRDMAKLISKARDYSASREIEMLTDADIQLHADKIRDDGYTVIERAADPALVEGLKQALERTEREHGL